jgi:protein-disulfide isomerase
VSRKAAFATVLFSLVFTAALGAQTDAAKSEPASPKTAARSDSTPASVEGRVEKYLRNLYAWGPAFEVKVGSPKPTPVADLLELSVTISKEGRADTASVYVSKDGNYLIRGEFSDMNVDPFAEIRSKLHTDNAPSMGPADAKVTLVEFGDLECPSCRQLDRILRAYLPQHPDVRLVFKQFPLTQVHPWAMTAATATQCAFHQNPAAFWKMHDAIYDDQDVITASNVWDKMIDLATQAGLNLDQFKTCMSSSDIANEIKQSMEEGRALNVSATPTTFVNGRRVVGPDQSLLGQYIQFQLAK